MNLIAEETDRISAKFLPESGCGATGYGGTNSRIVPRIRRLTSSGVPTASSLPLWISPTGCNAQPHPGRPWRKDGDLFPRSW